MLSAALAMFVCGWPEVLFRTANRPSTAVTLTTYRRGCGEASNSGSSRSHSRVGASALISCVSSTSAASSSPTRTDHELTGAVSGSSPASSISASARAPRLCPNASAGLNPGASRTFDGSAPVSPRTSAA